MEWYDEPIEPRDTSWALKVFNTWNDNERLAEFLERWHEALGHMGKEMEIDDVLVIIKVRNDAEAQQNPEDTAGESGAEDGA